MSNSIVNIFLILNVFLQVPFISTDDSVKDCVGSFDVVILLDSSVSLRDSDPYDRPLQTWKMMTNFTATFIQTLPINKNINVAVVQYSSESQIVQQLVARQNYDGSSLNDLRFMGRNTNTFSALSNSMTILSASGASRKIVVLITDGLSNLNVNSTIQAATSLKNSGVEIYCIGISNYIDSAGLSEISSGSQYFLQLRGQGQFESIRQKIVNRICQIPEPTEAPIPDCTTVENCKYCVTDPRICEVCDPGYYREGWFCKKCSAGIFDLTFLVDSSGSIQDKNNATGVSVDNYKVMLQFVVEMIDSLQVGINETRVAMIYFSNDARINFRLNELQYNRDNIANKVLSTQYLGARTNISGAFWLMNTDIYQQKNGDRPDVQNVCILIADGESNQDPERLKPETDYAKEHGTNIYVIGVTKDIFREQLLEVASSPADEHFFYSEDFSSIREGILRQLSGILCNGV